MILRAALPFVVKHWKLIAIVLLVIYIVGLNAAVRNYRAEAKRNAQDLKVVTGVVTSESIRTRFYKNKLGEQVAKTQKAEVSKQTLEKLMQDKEADWIRRFNAKPKQIESATTTEATVSGDGILMFALEPDKINCDTIKYFEWFIRDEYNDIYAIVTDTPQFEIRVPLYELETWERKKLMGFGPRIWPAKKEWFKQITTPNKLVKLNSQIIYTTRKKKE